MNADDNAISSSEQLAIITAAINLIGDPIVSFNDEGIIQWTNQPFQELVEQGEGDLVGRNFNQVMSLRLEDQFVVFGNQFLLLNDFSDQSLTKNTCIIPINDLDSVVENAKFLYLKHDQESVELVIKHHCYRFNDQLKQAHLLIMRNINKSQSNEEAFASKFVSNSTNYQSESDTFSSLSHLIDKHQQYDRNLINQNQQLRLIIANMPMIILVTDREGQLILAEGKDLVKINSVSGELIGHSIFDIYADQPIMLSSIKRCLRGEYHALSHYWHNLYFEIEYIPFVDNSSHDSSDNVSEKYGALIVCTDITEQFQYAESARLQNWRSVIFSNIAVKIHQSLDMSEILQTTVREVRHFLHTDRVLIYRFNDDWSGDVVVESVADDWSSTLGLNIVDTCFIEGMWQEYQNGKYVAIDDIYSSHLSECHRNLLKNLEVRSNLVVPIIENEKLWGLLIAHHCSEQRHWKKIELELLIQLATQLSIALYQAHLLNQETSQRKLLAQQNTELELARREAETATTMKSTFLAMMSHEIRTPMNAVLGMTGLLMDTDLNAEQLDFVNTIRFSGETLLSIINEILDFSKLEAEEMELEILNFNLLSCIEDCTDLLANTAHNQGIALYSWIDVNLPHELRGDVTRLKQVIINLINNAIKFTSEGEVIIHATLIAEYDDQVLIRISVQDTGIGIPEAKLVTLFTPFTQVDASTTRKYGGTGLGLAISRQLTELMGGKIGVISTENQGSEFWIEVPFTVNQPLKSEINYSLDLSVLTNCRVLVIDSHRTNCKLLDYQLSSYQMWVDTCENPITGLDLLHHAYASNKPYHIVIIDMHIAGIDGESLGRYIKSHPQLNQTHLIMLTSWTKRGMAHKYREIGFVACLNKPLKQSVLAECLVEIMTVGNHNLDLKNHDEDQTQININDDLDQGMLVTINESNSQLKSRSKSKFKSKSKSRLKSKLKILLVEDSLVNQKVIINQLRNLGYSADISGNGKEALALLDQISYDIVLMDCQMPELDGYDTTRAIRQLKTPQRNVVIIAMTANAMQADRQRCLDSGMNDYLSKPIRKELLQDKISIWEKYISEQEMLYSATESAKSLSEIISEYSSHQFPEIPEVEASPIKPLHDLSMTLPSKSFQPAAEFSSHPDHADVIKYLSDLGMLGIDQLNREFPLIDWEYLHSISGEDTEFEQDLVQTFIAGAPEILDGMVLGMEAKNLRQITAQAHLLKGSAASTGIQFIAYLAAIIESVGKKIVMNQEQQPNNLGLDLEALISAYFQLITAYINEINHHLIDLSNAI